MPEHIRSLIVIIILAVTIFVIAYRTATEISGADNFALRRNLWIALTFAAFLSGNFWIYVLLTFLLLVYASKRETNRVSLFFFLLFLLPIAYMPIPGMGMINYLFNLSHARLITLIILLPAMFILRQQSEGASFGKTWPDRIAVSFLLLSFFLNFRSPVISETLRYGVALFLDAYLPYFVISRSLKSMQQFRDALVSLILAIMVVAILANFEFLKHWLLYGYLTQVLNLAGGMTEYLGRNGVVRAIVTTGQPIALGYLMVVGIGIYLFLQRSIQTKYLRWGGMALLIGGLIAPLSRGPWVGAGILLSVYFITGRNPIRSLMTMAFAAILAFSLASVLPGGERVINLLPFIGTTEKENVDYREQLITNSMIVIQRSPWLGDSEYRETPEMEAMRQGQGIIDVVNTYLAIALSTGFIGLGLFIAFFMLVLFSVYQSMKLIRDKGSEEYLLGQALLSTQVAIMVIIFSVSSISIIPIVYWSVAGLAVAYVRMVRKEYELTQKKIN
jgi:O-antigen ligase